jgi:hypothetical protein
MALSLLNCRHSEKNYIFSVLCNIEIQTKNSLKYNTKKKFYKWKYSVIILSWNAKYHLYYRYFEIPKELPLVFSWNLRRVDFLKNSHTIYNTLLFRLYASMNCIISQFVITPFAPFSAHTLTCARMPLLEAVHDTQTNITLFSIEVGAPGFLI